MRLRKVAYSTQAQSQREGAGAWVHRTIGTGQLGNVDPFLLLDEFEFDAATGGFPDHPHRGFETVTYMFEGHIAHEDSAGNSGIIGPGDLQWLTTGKGLVHSELPAKRKGRIHGMQLWVNLPAKEKMKKPHYQDIEADTVPVVEKDGISVKVLAGEFDGTIGPVKGITLEPIYLDVTLTSGEATTIPVTKGHTTSIYTLTDGLTIAGKPVGKRNLVILADGDAFEVSGKKDARFLLMAAAPINEPVARYGPFVMNTREEIFQAMEDYRNGRF